MAVHEMVTLWKEKFWFVCLTFPNANTGEEKNDSAHMASSWQKKMLFGKRDQKWALTLNFLDRFVS